MDLMQRETMPEIVRQTLIQQDLHAIDASRDSFASSSACTAISCGTDGNCRKNSAKESPPSK